MIFLYKLHNISEFVGEWNSNINSIAAEGVERKWHQSSWNKKRHPKFIMWSKKNKKRLKRWSRGVRKIRKRLKRWSKERKRGVKMKVMLKMTGRVEMKHIWSRKPRKKFHLPHYQSLSLGILLMLGISIVDNPFLH
jgi:hypothetical protein